MIAEKTIKGGVKAEGKRKELPTVVKETVSELKKNPWFCQQELDCSDPPAFQTINCFDKLWQRITHSTNLLNALLQTIAMNNHMTQAAIS